MHASSLTNLQPANQAIHGQGVCYSDLHAVPRCKRHAILRVTDCVCRVVRFPQFWASSIYKFLRRQQALTNEPGSGTRAWISVPARLLRIKSSEHTSGSRHTQYGGRAASQPSPDPSAICHGQAKLSSWLRALSILRSDEHIIPVTHSHGRSTPPCANCQHGPHPPPACLTLAKPATCHASSRHVTDGHVSRWDCPNWIQTKRWDAAGGAFQEFRMQYLP